MDWISSTAPVRKTFFLRRTISGTFVTIHACLYAAVRTVCAPLISPPSTEATRLSVEPDGRVEGLVGRKRRAQPAKVGTVPDGVSDDQALARC